MACTSDSTVAPPHAGVLDSAPIHSAVAAEMPPGRLAALQVDSILGFDGDMEARSRTAVALWSHWADSIDQCLESSGSEEQVERFEHPDNAGPLWDMLREPTGPFRPYSRGWNEAHGLSSDSAKHFWEDERVQYLRLDSLSLMDTDCARSTYPYDSLIPRTDASTSYGTFLDALALRLHESFGEGPSSLHREWDEALEAEVGSKLPTGDWVDQCLFSEGVDEALVEGDHWELIADSGPTDAAVHYAVAEARCFETELGALDDQLLETATSFANRNERELTERLAIAEEVTAWLATQ